MISLPHPDFKLPPMRRGRVFGSTLVANIANQDCGGLVASSDTKPANVAIRNILPIPAPATATTAII